MLGMITQAEWLYPGGMMALRAAQAVNDALLDCCRDLCTQHALQLLLGHDHGIVHQVPDDLIHIPPVEPHLSKFCGLHLS